MPRCSWLVLAMVMLVVPIAGQAPGDPQPAAGWAAIQQGDAARAATVFADALRRNPRDPMLHVGAGWAAHLLGRDQYAIESLTRAQALNPKLAIAAELLGEIEYLQGDLGGAIRRFEQALPFAADRTAAMQRRLAEWRKEAAVHETLAERNEARFSVVFNGRSDNFLSGHTVALLERAFMRIGQALGVFPSQRILVTLYSEQQFRDITQAPAWAGGQFDGKIRIPVQGVSQNMDEFDRILVHELTHAMIHGLAPRGVPAWLHEGLAGYFEPRDAARAERRVQALGVVMPFSQLHDSFGRFNAAQAEVAYDESLVAVDILTRLAGPRMAVLLQGLGSGQSFEQSMALLGLQASDFEAQVIRRLRR